MSTKDMPPAAGDAEKQQQGWHKQTYRKPSLIVHGSVRNLTATITGSGPGDGGSKRPSEPALKENIVRVGTHALGFGLYLFDYKAAFRDAYGHERQFGVMADEVEQIVPAAVSLHEAGHRVVDYTMLGIA